MVKICINEKKFLKKDRSNNRFKKILINIDYIKLTKLYDFLWFVGTPMERKTIKKFTCLCMLFKFVVWLAFDEGKLKTLSHKA